MATVVNKTTFQVIKSVHTPDYRNGEWLINPDIPDAPKRHWKINGDSLVLKSAAEIADADAQWLSESKPNKKNELKHELGEALGSKYDNDEKLSLLLILQLAVATGNTARVGYVSQLAGWIDQGQDLLYAAQDSVDAATTVEDVENIQLDLSSWLAADPQVVIRTAKGIE